jgi:hypothetical protein
VAQAALTADPGRHDAGTGVGPANPAPPPAGVLSPAPTGQWERLWRAAPGALPSQSPRWLRAVCEIDGWRDASRLYHVGDGRRLVLPMVRRAGVPGLALEESLPYGWGPGGLLAEDGVVTADDVRMVVADLAHGRVLRSQIRPDPTTGGAWAAGVPPRLPRVPRTAQSLDLDGGFDTVWRTRFRSDTRTRVRRAERAGVEVRVDTGGALVPVFQELYARSVQRWARQAGRPLPLARWRAARREPPGKLAHVARALGEDCRVYAAFLDGRPAAAIVVLFAPTTAAYWRGAMDEEVAGRSYANYLLHRTAIADAAQAGCRVYHMGDSAPGSSLAMFKSRFGAVEHPYASYRFERVPLSPAVDALRGAAARVLRRGTASP